MRLHQADACSLCSFHLKAKETTQPDWRRRPDSIMIVLNSAPGPRAFLQHPRICVQDLGLGSPLKRSSHSCTYLSNALAWISRQHNFLFSYHNFFKYFLFSWQQASWIPVCLGMLCFPIIPAWEPVPYIKQVNFYFFCYLLALLKEKCYVWILLVRFPWWALSCKSTVVVIQCFSSWVRWY